MDVQGYHITIKGVLHQYGYDYFKDISGCVVVEHREGLTQKERPHYHIWIPPSDSIPRIKRALRSYYDEKNEDLNWNTHANAYYSVTPHNSYEKWLKYTIDPEKASVKKPTIVLWNLPGSPPEVRPAAELIVSGLDGGIAPSGATGPTVVVASRKHVTTEDKQKKFYQFVKEYYQENKGEEVSYNSVARLLDDYAKGGFNEMAAPQYIEFAMYNYLKDSGDKVRFKERQEDWVTRVLARLRK